MPPTAPHACISPVYSFGVASVRWEDGLLDSRGTLHVWNNGGLQDLTGLVTKASSESLFEEESVPSVVISRPACLNTSPVPGCTMPIPDACHPGCGPRLVQLARGAAPTWECFNPELEYTVRRINIRKRGTTPFQMKLPGMLKRLKVRDGCIVPSQPEGTPNPLSKSMRNPTAEPHDLALGNYMRHAGVSASQSAEILRNWLRPHRSGWSGATVCGGSPRFRLGFVHPRILQHRTTAHLPVSTPLTGLDIGSQVPDPLLISQRSFARIPLISELAGEALTARADSAASCSWEGSVVLTSMSSPCLVTAIGVPPSNSWDEIVQDLVCAATEYRQWLECPVDLGVLVEGLGFLPDTSDKLKTTTSDASVVDWSNSTTIRPPSSR
ncbi:uncharacterized protein FIBRA_01017 [Fibroporia radiculosa]|uniref:Uncharacterized protein n=1 Tax=Fibroporia radiculosa TaxID=599839 RepID=J4H0V5_9APHY|nr:uncharacterized protein FIBRA_01017 [Fibroporia radiculosa]CCL99009.1 predicted protein [Fibroporia radiculosa]